MNHGFQDMLDHIRSIADSETHKGRLFERVMKAYFLKDPLYADRFSDVWLWAEWARSRPNFTAKDTGIDLVAKEIDGGYCAIQCKCYAPDTRISRDNIDRFIAASARDPFTARMVVDTGREWGENATSAILSLKPACALVRFGDLAGRSFNWPDLVHGVPEDLSFHNKPFKLRPHQETAFKDVIEGFSDHDRGKLIMACGTGKTLTSLRIAERIAGIGGQVLYLVPSISLFAQSMREWATHREIPHSYIGICSDTRTGNNSEDASLQELEIPVTTCPTAIFNKLHETRKDSMTVVFCTYQSLEIVESVQDSGASEFDIVFCDEAHRTTGIERPDDKTSPFVLVHNSQRIRTKKRLYMTATPRLYTEGARKKAAAHNIEVFSMNDPEVYGPEFHHLPFSRAIEQDLLSDYRVVVLAMSEQDVTSALEAHLVSSGSEININDATKIVGCWRALQNPENKPLEDKHAPRVMRAIAFTNQIKSSKRMEAHWSRIIEQATKSLPESAQKMPFRCEIRHVDGQHHALDRKARIEWLKEAPGEICRILSNARCLSEGIDVPALDAVLFMEPRNSQVAVVQAVGRVMRKAPGKKYGYIILPVAIPPGVDPADALDDNERFATVWGVLRALRSHDDRLNAEINKMDLNENPPPWIIFSGSGISKDPGSGEVMGPTGTLEGPLLPLQLPPDAIYAKIVEKCGDRKYWETWAKDVANIFPRLTHRIENLLNSSKNQTLRAQFNAFHKDVETSVYKSISPEVAVGMLAQHILTRPVFDALFENYNFSDNNPMAQALDRLEQEFKKFGLENETRDLESFYESVRARSQGLDNAPARQKVLMELYEKFFATAMKKDSERLGIVYTPVEVVDFILNSVDQVLRKELGRSLTDSGVHVLDPFTGTGIFLARLLQSKLIRDSDLARKYHHELHANEIVLLAYYIAAVHIEEAFHSRCPLSSSYESFDGIVLTDTFNLHSEKSGFHAEWLPDNSKRVEHQQQLPIEVIVGNPPWSAWQKSAADNNQNVIYPEMRTRIRETYAAHSSATSQNSLYDTYKMAIRWASDRIGSCSAGGVVAFVTNGSWIDGFADSGVRACMAEEFSTIYVLNLRGNQRTRGDLSHREGGKIFGQGSRAGVAITILARKPNAKKGQCRILYHDIGDYLTRAEKLKFLLEAKSILGIKGWQEIIPNQDFDWINQRSDKFQELYPVASKDAKAGRSNSAIFKLFSSGYKTGRDASIYNFSYTACAENARWMVKEYLEAMQELKASGAAADLESTTARHSKHVRWDPELKNKLQRQKEPMFTDTCIRRSIYRPFVATNCYTDFMFASRKYMQDRIFPTKGSKNHAICVPGKSSNHPHSALMVDSMPDLGLMEACQCFPRYRYEKIESTQGNFPGFEPKVERVDNITDTSLRVFRVHWSDNTITKDQIFYYVYAILHAPEYRQRFTSDLTKELPRIPFADNFHAFAQAGQELADLHLGFEKCKEYPLETTFTPPPPPPVFREAIYRLSSKAMRYGNDEKSVLRINENVSLCGIPPEAHRYAISGRTPLEWFIDRYRITQDKHSKIVNDPNEWFKKPEDLVTAIRRIVYVSVETTRIVEGLPNPFPADYAQGT